MHEVLDESFDRAVELIYDAALDPDRMPAVIGAIAEATSARGGMLGIYDVCTGDGPRRGLPDSTPRCSSSTISATR